MSEKEIVKPIILVICNFYLPGRRGGGGIWTLVEMIENFREQFDFRVITYDREPDGEIYPNIEYETWNDIEGIPVYYLSKGSGMLKLRELIKNIRPTAVYLNSVFSALTVFYLLLRKLKMISTIPTVLAPNGELSEGALKSKSYKKKPFVQTAKLLGLYRNLIWKTTAEAEMNEAERFRSGEGKVFLAPNLTSPKLLENYRQESKPPKHIGEAKLVFLARFLRIKNFKWLVENLKSFAGNLTIDLYGPIEDQNYWAETEKEIKKLPSNVNINYRGFLDYEKVQKTLLNYHFFILPTLGENFGYVFIEAMAAGCPLVISDKTPWRNLEDKKIGWDLSLNDPEQWRKVLMHCVNLDQLSYTEISEKSRDFAIRQITDSDVRELTLTVLREVTAEYN